MNIQLKKYPIALSQFQETLKIRDTLAAKNPRAFDLDLCNSILTISILYTIAPEACAEIKDKFPADLDTAIAILKKYPHIPQAQQYLEADLPGWVMGA